MPLPVEDDDFREIEWRDTFEASHIDPELVRARAPFVVRIDPAGGAEVMLGGLRVEAIGRDSSSPSLIRKCSSVDVTAIAPRIRQMLQLQRLAEEKPNGSVAVNFTAPQWHEPLSVSGSLAAVLITPRLSPARLSPPRLPPWPLRHPGRPLGPCRDDRRHPARRVLQRPP